MFHQQKYSGTDYTTTAALLAVAFVFSPAILALSQPFGLLAISLCAAVSTTSVALAWLNWRRRSNLTIPTLEAPSTRRE